MSRVYLDANGFAYAFDANLFRFALSRDLGACAAWRAPASGERLYDRRSSGQACPTRPTLEGNFYQLVFSVEQSGSRTFPAEASLIFVQLRASQRVKPLDALHLACAAYAGADLFLTNDAALQRLVVPGIGRIAPLDFPF